MSAIIQKCYVKTVDGVQFVFMPDGTQLPCIVNTKVEQGVDDVKCGERSKSIAHCTVELIVELKE